MKKSTFKLFGKIPLFTREISDSKAPREDNAVMAYGGYSPGYGLGFSVSFNGEKSQGGIGPILDYKMNYAALRARSRQLYVDSEICRIIVDKTALWTIGSGLKLQSEPKEAALKTENISEDFSAFADAAEARFDVYANSRYADYAGMKTLHELANTGFVESEIGGDTLVILRYIDGVTKVQLIDGSNLCNPGNLTINGYDFITSEGNRVRHGVEINERGEHVAYHIKDAETGSRRIAAKTEKYNLVQAFLWYGDEMGVDSVRGVPSLMPILETAKKLERYAQATLSKAEEAAKIALAIEHDVNGTGANDFDGAIAAASGNELTGDLATLQDGEVLRNKVAATTEKQVINLTPGAKIKTLANESELYYKDFSSSHVDTMCAATGIPPNVAMDKYDDSYSSSRASIKSWEHNLNVRRKRSSVFYQYVYKFWLFVEIHTGKIQSPAYLKALETNNVLVLAAYEHARWVGAMVPHIDPVKEVEAERAKLGALGQFMVLGTGESSTEALNGGEYIENTKQFVKELQSLVDLMKDAGIPMPAMNSNNNQPAKKENPETDKK